MSKSIEALKQRIFANTWYQKGFEASAFTLLQWRKTLESQAHDKFYKAYLKELVLIYQNNRCDFFWNTADLESIRKWLVKRVQKDKNFPKNLIARWRQESGDLFGLLKKFIPSDLTKYTDMKLAAEFDALMDAYNRSITVSVILEGFSLRAEQWLGDMLMDFLKTKKLEHKFGEYCSILTRTTRPSFIQEAAMAKAAGTKPSELAKKYFWIHFNYVHTTPLSSSYFKSMSVEHIPDLRAVASQKRTLMAQLRVPAGLRRILEASDIFTWWQDQRKKYCLQMNYAMLKFLEEVARRTKISKKQLLMADPFRFSELLNVKSGYRSVVQKLSEPVFYYSRDDDEPLVLTGKTVRQILNSLTSAKEVKEFSGIPTYFGNCTGKVVLLKYVTDMRRVKKGDILVTSMTRPEYTPVLPLAGAIITDEGGIASHASIISREFKIPCVIGTKIATKVLKDGDMVEVDANKGIVKILKRK